MTTYLATLAQSGEQLAQDEIEALRLQYGLDQPFYMQYLKLPDGIKGFHLQGLGTNDHYLGHRGYHQFDTAALPKRRHLQSAKAH